MVLSPGPGHPADPVDFAVGTEVLRTARVPVLGVCLGMQGLVTAYGGLVERVPPAHGDVAEVTHDGTGLFAGIPSPYPVVRYHSLAATRVPDELAVTARCTGEDGAEVVMAVRHTSRPLHGVQFHPESILSEHGARLVTNFLGGVVTDPVERFVAMAAEHERCFWLDGGGARPWSGRRSLLGWLDEDDVSLTYDAARGEVVRHRAAPRRWSATTSSRRSRPRRPATARTCTGSATSATPAAPTCPRWSTRRTRCRPRSGCAPPTSTSSSTPSWSTEPVIAARAGEVDVPEDYAAAFADVQEQLRAGNSYEVNLTHRLTVHSDLDPVAAYLRLRDLNPAPYAGFLQHRGRWLLSSSPERYATVDRHRRIETKPIKGTTPRGGTPAEDARLRELLATDPKFRAENLMIVDLLRNDIGMVGEVGSVEVPVLMDVESYPSVHQLVSTVRGVLRDDVTTVGALRALFPAGSMTGAPKLRTMEVIRDVEATARGVYAGAFGWISGDGQADLGVVIRSLTTAGDGTWTLGTGGGITVRSDVAEEYAESRWKAERLLRVFD